jgi:branched-chain amino acid transport system ATP-binding protein
MSFEVLRISDLHAWYGESHVLHGIEMHVREGELVTLLGRNGAGRTTTLKALLGLIKRTGSAKVLGTETIKLPPHKVARMGIGYCPEERGIFAALSVEENLKLLPTLKPGGMSVDELYVMFPNLKEKRKKPGTSLSGGEQQMLALARILRTGARLLLLDEITEGLAPVIVQEIGSVITKLKQMGFSMILAEQNFHFLAPLADRNYVIEQGRVVAEVHHDDLAEKSAMLNRLLGVGA